MDKNQERYYSMKSRCYCKTNKVYPFYGGRGIKVCDRWLGKNGFKYFMEDMGEPPTEEIEKMVEAFGHWIELIRMTIIVLKTVSGAQDKNRLLTGDIKVLEWG